MRYANIVNRCDNCGLTTRDGLYHFDAEYGNLNPFDQGALCDACTTLAVKIDDGIRFNSEAARGAARESAKPLEAIDACERLILWNEGQASAKMDASSGEHMAALESEGDERTRRFALSLEYVMSGGAHMRAAHDLRFVRDKLIGGD